MTTPASEKLYQAQHGVDMEGKGWAIYNPKKMPTKDLPTIYGFNNGGSTGMLSAQLIAEDGIGLGSHCCSHECYMEHDLGILEGTMPGRHNDDFKKHYPNGYKMEFIGYDKVKDHKELNKAIELNQKQSND